MRRFAQRPCLPVATQTKLAKRTNEILQVAVGEARRKRAREIYDSSRQAKWFEPIVNALRNLCGHGELCMYCSSNEPSQVEHFRPLVVFPEDALNYNNFLWTCDICNRTYKGERFPPTTEQGAPILNPLDDDVWEYFFIDNEFGRLVRRYDPVAQQPSARATSTCDVVGIDRENVQIKRSRRFDGLRRDVESTLLKFQAGTLNVAALRGEIANWRSEPFQADVADYFLNGPGRSKEPFRSVLVAAGEPMA